MLFIPSAASKSGSVVQLSLPSFNALVLVVFPAEVTCPVDKIIPSSNGKFELALSKYPKL